MQTETATREELLERVRGLEAELGFYRDLYENSPEMQVTVDAETGEVKHCNQTLATRLGRTKEAIIGAPVFELYHPDCHDAAHAAFESFVTAGVVAGARLQLRHGAGHKIDVLLDVNAVRDGGGKVVQSRSVWREIPHSVSAEEARKESERALRLSEEKLRVLFEGSSEIITLTDAQANPLMVNPAWKALFGDELDIEQNPFERIHPGDMQKVAEAWDGLLTRGEPIRALVYRYRVGGEYHHFDSNAFPVTVAGETLHYVVARDVTDRKLSEEALRRSEQDYRSLFESAQVGMYQTKIDGSEVLAVNNKLCEIFGYSREEVLTNPSFIHWERPTDREEMVSRLARDGSLQDHEIRMVAKGGEVKTCLSSARIDRKRGVLEGSIIDITALTRAQVSLRDSEAKFRNLVENMSEVFFRIDLTGEPSYVSPSVERLLGFTPEELVDTSIWSYIHPGDLEVAQSGWERTLHNGDSGNEYRVRTKTGEYKWIRSSARPAYDGDRIVGLHGLVNDVTDRKVAELELSRYRTHLEELVEERTADLRAKAAELRVSNRELEAFAYSISHDLRAPLRAIDGFSRALLEDYGDVIDATGTDHLNRVRGAAQRMGAQIDALLQLSRLSRVDPSVVELDLSGLARSVVRELRSCDCARKEGVKVDIEPDLRAEGDETLMRSALQNLLANAWKFTSETPNPRIELGAVAVDGERAFFVRDNGAGFDMAYAGKLFGVFQRLHDTTEFPGTGVGLATVQRVIERHGGRVWGEARVGEGATFFFTLPGQGAEGEG